MQNLKTSNFKLIYPKAWIALLFGFLTTIVSCTKDSPDAPQKESFIKYLGGPYQNTANGMVEVNGDFYVLGTISETNKTFLQVIKTDAYGNSVWTKDFSDSVYSITGSQIKVTKDGNAVAIIGTRISDNDSLYGDFYFVKLSLTGELLLEKRYPYAYNQVGQSITELNNGGFLLCGTSANQASTSGKFQFTLTIRPDGEPLRIPVARGSDGESIRQLIQIDNDSIIWGIGNTQNKQSGFSNGSPQLLVFSDQQGTAPATIEYTAIHGVFNNIIQIDEQNLMVCGTRYTNSSHTDGFIALIKKSNYELSNFVPFVNNENSQWNALVKSESGTILIAGSKVNTNGDYDLQILDVTMEGTINLQKTFGYKDNEYGVSLTETDDRRIVALGTFNYETNGMIGLLKFKLN